MIEQARVTMKHREGRPGSHTVFNVIREHSNHSFHGEEHEVELHQIVSVYDFLQLSPC